MDGLSKLDRAELVRRMREDFEATLLKVRQMSADVKLGLAGQIVAVTDGAEWIRRLIEANLPERSTVILDFDHAAGHVHQARRIVFGEENANGGEWANQLLAQLIDSTFEQCWETLTQTRAKLRSKAKQTAMDDLMRYLLERKQKVAYASFKAAGMDIGSGPTESMCKSLSRRMKGIGMRWTPKNADSIVALQALHQSNLWPNYGSTRLAA